MRVIVRGNSNKKTARVSIENLECWCLNFNTYCHQKEWTFPSMTVFQNALLKNKSHCHINKITGKLYHNKINIKPPLLENFTHNGDLLTPHCIWLLNVEFKSQHLIPLSATYDRDHQLNRTFYNDIFFNPISFSPQSNNMIT